MKRTLIKELTTTINEEGQQIYGWVHNIRDKGKIAFLEVRDRTSPIQVVIDNPEGKTLDIKKYDIVSFTGTPTTSGVKSGIPGVEFQATDHQVLTSPKEDYPLPISTKAQNNPDQEFNHRVLSVRNPKNNALFKIQADIAKHFSEYMRSEGFTQIFSPKIVPQIAEGGANMFKIDYFGRDAFLAQSPQLYKQIMVGSGLERVFEIGPVFRAEKHNTSRHINEYISLDMEMGFIDSYTELMDLEESMMQYILGKINEEHGDEIQQYFKTSINVPKETPRLALNEGIDIIKSKYGYKNREEGDIDPKAERLLTKYAQEEHGSDFIFITNYPTKKRPFYTMPTPGNPEITEGFDLIYRGLEITTGGQRIHDYEQLLSNLRIFGLTDKGLEKYLDAFKYGMPPHGGMGIGLERTTAKALGLDNIKYASLFPRDVKRLEP
ncbi:aspartate--tRNA(Asn) ligase [Candidatus Woesearchaeota archaeon]|nr:aspartate--tRNA(Asn) ligase [Candidatus Woesearchaeota archaeon]